jgi:dipeptidyl-peptidase-3
MTEKKYTGELERLGPGGTDIMVLGVEAEGFDELTMDEKRYAYCLYRASIPGNRIAYMQAHRDALEIRELLEAVFLASDEMDPALHDAVHDYLKYVWIHHGQYDHYTHTKYVPTSLTPEGLKAACEHTIGNGANIPKGDESLDAMLERLHASIFDASHEAIQTNQSEGIDGVAESAVNYYGPGVTTADLEALPPQLQRKLNARYEKRGDETVVQEFRIGGLYNDEIEAIVYFLEMAQRYSPSDHHRESLELLVAFYRDGDEETFKKHMVSWLGMDGNVDYLNGFIEVYLDPRGVVGQFEGNVSFKAGGGLIDAISDHSLYFEERMPWPDEFKRTEVTPPVANVVNVLVETGDAGPVSPAAYNLPNYNDIRRDHGSKNVILANVENTWSRELMQEQADAFFLPEYRDNLMRYFRPLIRAIEVYLHEIVGHGSGRPADGLDGDPRTLLGRAYSGLEECRADSVALWHIADPQLVEMGAFGADEQDAVVKTAYVTYLQGWFSRIDRVPGLEVREAHNKGHHAILNWILEGGESGEDYGAEMIQEDGDFYVRVNNPARVREGIGALLSRLQVFKSTGDRAGAEAFFDRFGTHLPPEWKANVEKRRARLTTPKMKAFVFPHLVPRIENGEIADVELRYDEDLTAQQLRFTRIELSKDVAAD